MDLVDNRYVADYYALLDKKAIIPEKLTDVFKVAFAPSGSILVSDSILMRVFGRLRRMERICKADAGTKSLQFFALSDAFSLLHQKGVPVYYYNRIGKLKNGYQYSESEERRMKEGLSFPLMYRDIDKYETELKDIFGELYSREYIEEIGRIPQVIKVGSVYEHENYQSKLINVDDGKRVTLYQPADHTRSIHVYGRCGVFGYAVEDRDTLPSLLQKELIDNGITDVKVINHGLWGGEDEYLDHNFLQEAIGMKQGDIVLFYRMHFDKRLLAEFIKRGVRYKELTEEWHARKNEAVSFFDRPGHMNADGYKLVAKLICEDLMRTDLTCGEAEECESPITADNLNYYLKSQADDDLEEEVGKYINNINRDFPLQDNLQNNGAIVMNCNPFTYGHRYLIETAAAQVDRLYIFVVEEDRSFFRFEDRLEMVRRGTEDLNNVVIVPSGKFIISAYTFPEYFMKDYVKEKSFDVSMDVRTFCRYIAPPLNIRKRFAGEEPFDPVTGNYNENMARILPEYGMEFVEIPRLSLDGERVINATRVRELLKEKNTDELREYVPSGTLEVLMSKYY
ncbi:MAG: adenylyltransferase/cytidyltransferase family protein [Lachnospiraceae bacterium]|nr:adenylyltransferase/cytidyltransferase family protein [Lachnospiraceae bacterium]